MHGYVLKLVYDYTAGYVVSAALSLPFLSSMSDHRLGLETLFAAIISIPLALLGASLYHKFLNKTIYARFKI